MAYRDDGSIESSNTPTLENQRRGMDHGLYMGIVRRRYLVGEKQNQTNELTQEVTYDVQIVGGSRDGQILTNCRAAKKFSGRLNSESWVYKATKVPFGLLDPSSPLYPIPIAQQDGDFVYVGFLDGSPFTPVILGAANHPGSDQPEAEEGEDGVHRFRWNGVKRVIEKDGTLTFTKAQGAVLPVFPSLTTPTSPYVDEFVPLLGFEESVKVTMGNKQDMTFETLTGMKIDVQGLTDAMTFSTAVGAKVALSGVTDSLDLATAAGAKVAISGLTDKVEVATTAGAKVEVSGLTDEVTVTTTAGTKAVFSGLSGVEITDTIGNKIKTGAAGLEITTTAGGKFAVNAAGLVEVGNATGDALKILGELIQTLSTETAAGFGAPLTGAPLYAQLLIKLKLITG